MNRAVISTNDNLDYAFLAPFSALCWTLRGFRPLLVPVGTAEQWLDDPRLRLVLERSREVGAEIHFVDVPGTKTATVAQCARLFAAGLPGVADGDYLVTGDVDMLTVGKWPGGHPIHYPRDETKPLHLWFANAYSSGPCPHDGGRTNPCQHFPICYVGASAKTWREIVGLEGLLDGCALALEAMLVGVPVDDPARSWSYDELWLGERIRSWSGFLDQARLIERTFVPGEWRLDRSDWHVHEPAWRAENMKSGLEGVADAHLPRPGWTDDGWAKIRPLLEMALPEKLHGWMDSYREAFAR